MRFGVVARPKKLESVNKSVAVVILARYSSTRLPGKALMTIAGKSVLQHIVDRLLKVVDREQLILACSDLESDDQLEDFARQSGIAVYRGSLERVGERFFAAAQQLGADYAVRLNGDNIFLDPQLLAEMMAISSKGQYRFLSNVQGRTFPKGMSVEIVELNYYQQHLPAIKKDAYCNEHVMVCLYQDPPPPEHFYLKNTSLPEAAGIQLALDTPEDLERSRWILKALPEEHFDLKTTFDYYRRYEEFIKG